MGSPKKARIPSPMYLSSAGVQRLFLWPVGDPIEQLELFGERVAPLLDVR
jgi:hypothetical protein